MIETSTHQGHKVKRIREIMQIKQESLAIDLGLSQQAISDLERRETIDAETMKRIAKSLNVPVETIDNFSDESVIYYIQNNHENSNNKGNNVDNYNQCTINPLEKYVEQVEKNEKLQEKNEVLYQSLLKEKDEKIALLERLLEKK